MRYAYCALQRLSPSSGCIYRYEGNLSLIMYFSVDYDLRAMLTACPASLIEGRAHETILEDGARRGVPRRRLVTAAPGGTGPRPPGTTTRTRGARCDRSGSNSGEGSAGPEPKIATVRAPGGERPPYWDARRLARCLACPRHGQAQRVPRKHPTTLGAPPPLNRGSEAKVSKPGRKKRAAGTKKLVLFDIVSKFTTWLRPGRR